MARTNWKRRFFSSTRGQIITLLRRFSPRSSRSALAMLSESTHVREHYLLKGRKSSPFLCDHIVELYT